MARKPQTEKDYHELSQSLRGLEADLRWGLNGSARIPAEWYSISQEAFVPQKQKITLRLDSDVITFYRSMGGGHLTRMNAVLRTFMLARLAGVVPAVPINNKTPDDIAMECKQEEMAIIRSLMQLRIDAREAGIDLDAVQQNIKASFNALMAGINAQE